jgi:hypothetical protein
LATFGVADSEKLRLGLRRRKLLVVRVVRRVIRLSVSIARILCATMCASEDASYNAATTTLGCIMATMHRCGTNRQHCRTSRPQMATLTPNGPQMAIWKSIEGPNRQQRGQIGNFDCQGDKMATHPKKKYST